MPENRIELQTRARDLHAKIRGWEDDYRRAEARKEELEVELRQCQTRLEITVESQQRADERIAAAKEELAGINRLIPQNVLDPPKPPPQPERTVGAGKARHEILRMRVFTVAELAAVLKVTKRQTEVLLADEEAKGVVKNTGRRFGRSPIYEYVAPTDPGDAFRVQQQQRDDESEDAVYADPIAGVGEGYLAALPKDVRKVARQAMREGWALSGNGSGHYQLSNGEVSISLSATPQNPGAEAAALRRRLNGAGIGNLVRRGAEVPNTGKPIGSSGKPGLDKDRANAGKHVRRKGRKGL